MGVMSRRIEVSETGEPEVLRWVDWEAGEPGERKVRVRVEAAGVNFIDIYFRTGLYPMPLPYAAGLEGAGTVEAVGGGVADFAVGDRVAWAQAPGSYAEVALLPAKVLVPIPAGLDVEVAAAAMLQGMTAHYLAHSLRALEAGDSALVHAAAGGTGLLLVQMLRDLGVRVIGTCSSAAKAALAKDAGAEHIIRYDSEDFEEATKALTDGRGVAVVYDSVGQSTFEKSLLCLQPRGLMALFGQSSGPVPPFELQRLNALGSLSITRPSLGHFVATRDELEARASAVLGAAANGALKVRIGARFPMRDAADAHRALAGRGTTGKVLLTRS